MVFRLRVTLTGIKGFFRIYHVNGATTLYTLHKQMRADMEFPQDQLIMFKALDIEGAVVGRYGLFDLGYGSMDRVNFSQLAEKGQNVLQFCYDMHNNSCIILTILGEEPEDPRSHYPQTTLEKGHNPDQFSAKYEDPQVYIPRGAGSPAVDDDDEDEDDEDDEKDDDNAFSEFEDGLDSGSDD